MKPYFFDENMVKTDSPEEVFEKFTMSKEVEVKGIQMTATVPSDLQISLGEITDGGNTNNLAKSTGILALDGTVAKAPADQDDDDPYDWSNTIDISAYYEFGKLIPAASTDGKNVFFTPDAAGLGDTVKDGAVSYQAAEGITAKAGTTVGGATGSASLNATAHVYTSTEKTDANTHAWSTDETLKYVSAASWNDTQDDGYYIDIPVWLRTSSTEDKYVYVTGYVKQGNGYTAVDNDDDELYKAVRVAVLSGDGTGSKGCVDLKGFATSETASYPAYILTSTDTLIDSTIANNKFSLSGKKALNRTATMSDSTYADVVINDGGSSNSIGTLSAKTTNAQYGQMQKFIIRVWLEGDDENCWNPNAGQDWSISLKFMTDPLTAVT